MADLASENDLERSTIAKAALRLLPLIGLGYGIAYIDRVNISFASLQMNADLKFSATIYGLGAGLFFLSYALFEIPSNLLLVKFGARRWIARIMLTWGLLAAGMMFVRTPMHFYIIRFLLGLAEAGFFPGVIYYLSHWFPSAYRGRAISRFYIAVPLSSVVMGALAGALLDLKGAFGLAGWQWLFLVEGAPAILIGAVFLFYLPESPAAVAWLSPREKAWLEARLASDAALIAEPTRSSVLSVLANPLVLQLAAVNFIMLGAFYAFTLSAPALLDQITHLGPTKVGYLTAGAGLVGAATMLLNGWRSDRTGERYLHLAVPILLMAAAFMVLATNPSPGVAIAAYLLAVGANFAAQPVFWLVPGDLLHPRAMAVSVAGINSIGQLGSFISPYAWGLAKDGTGSYQAGLTVLPVVFLAAAAIVIALRQQARTRAAHAAGGAGDIGGA